MLLVEYPRALRRLFQGLCDLALLLSFAIPLFYLTPYIVESVAAGRVMAPLGDFLTVRIIISALVAGLIVWPLVRWVAGKLGDEVGRQIARGE